MLSIVISRVRRLGGAVAVGPEASNWSHGDTPSTGHRSIPPTLELPPGTCGASGPPERHPDEKRPTTVAGLAELGRVRLSAHFFLRDFLFSDIATIHGVQNIPDDPDLAILAGTALCTQLLEPLQAAFGRIAIRSAYRSAEVNGLGNRLGDNCASNATAASLHIWDRRDPAGFAGAMACIVVPRVWDRFHQDGEWRKLAWWIHDHLPYSRLQFFPKLFAFNIAWHERPCRIITSYAAPKGILTKPGMANHAGSHETDWRDIQACLKQGRDPRP